MSDEVLIRARGRAISRTVDTAEVVRNKFMQGLLDVKDIKTRQSSSWGEREIR